MIEPENLNFMLLLSCYSPCPLFHSDIFTLFVCSYDNCISYVSCCYFTTQLYFKSMCTTKLSFHNQSSISLVSQSHVWWFLCLHNFIGFHCYDHSHFISIIANVALLVRPHHIFTHEKHTTLVLISIYFTNPLLLDSKLQAHFLPPSISLCSNANQWTSHIKTSNGISLLRLHHVYTTQ
jgi:hypothetical protein